MVSVHLFISGADSCAPFKVRVGAARKRKGLTDVGTTVHVPSPRSSSPAEMQGHIQGAVHGFEKGTGCKLQDLKNAQATGGTFSTPPLG